ncbi:MAG TPA: response regulator [Steroidobacteraceae bacterium]|nr:response regulator [Steroidobacteraceae bacterium]
MGSEESNRSLIRELAHELRDALSPLASSADLARLRGFDADASQLLADKVERGLRRTRAILDAFVLAEQYEVGALQLALRSVPLADILQAIRAELVEHETGRIAFVPASGQAVVRADAERSAQALRALLQELAATAVNGSPIEVQPASTAEPEIRIHTHGDPRALPRMALRTARRIMELQGGELELVGKSEVGCELVIRFRAAEEQTAPAGPPAPSAGMSRPSVPTDAGGVHSILIVDDSVEVRRSYREVLGALGYTVTEAGDAEQALQALERGVPDVALIDIHLPRMSGYRLAQTIRSRAGASIHLVMLCGTTLDAATRKLAREAGFDECLDKMAGPIALRKMIASAVAPKP